LVINVLFFLKKKKEAMMTVETFTNKDSKNLEHSLFAAPQIEATPDLRRKELHRCCNRVRVSCLPGSELLVEYLFGKYIKNHSHHSIRRSCAVVLSFLRFLENIGQSIYTLAPKEIGAFVEFEQARGLKPLSIINSLEAINTFLCFLVKQKVLPH
jgi:hypothetical protein